MSVLENVMVGTHLWARRGNFWRTILNFLSVRREEVKIYEDAMEILSLTILSIWRRKSQTICHMDSSVC